MACGRRFCFVDAGAVQYVVDLFCGRVLRVFGDTPVVEGGPFTFDDAGDEPRLVGRGPNACTIHLVSDIMPWKLKVEVCHGEKLVITELAFRGVAVARDRVYTDRSCFALNVACPGGAAFKAQWFHRVAVDCPDADPTRLTCVMKYFMAYMDWFPKQSGGKAEVCVRNRISTSLKYFGVQPGHLRQSLRSRQRLDYNDNLARSLGPGTEEDEFYSISIKAMLLCICKLLQSNCTPSGAKLDPDPDAAYFALLRGLLQWPLRDVPTWGFSMDGVDFSLRTASLTSRC